MVACFEPQWNSLDVNKTRSFDILGAVQAPECTVLLHLFRRGKAAASEPCTGASEVFVKSGGRLGRQPLEKPQIEFRRLADEAGQQSVGLPAVVSLVVEPVRQRRGQLLLELLR